MKFIITFLFFLLPTVVAYALPPLPQTYVNEEEKVWYYSSLPSEKCRTADFPQEWKNIGFDEPPVDYKLQEPEWIWTKIISFTTVARARECGMLFSEGSPIWKYFAIITSLLLGILCGSYILRKVFLKKLKK